MAPKRYRNLEGIKHHLSKEIPAEVYEHLDLPLLFRPRISIYANEIDEAILECRKDLRAAGIHNLGYATYSEVAGSANSLWFPDSACDRQKICAYLNEYAMLHDNWVDDAKTSEEYDMTNASLAFLRGNENSKIENKSQKGIQAKFVYQMLTTGSIWGKVMIQDYKNFLAISSDERDRALAAPKFAEYMEFRREDSGATFFMHEIIFCKANSLGPKEVEPIKHIMHMAGHILGLTNDYCSYEKEVDEWERRGRTGQIVNAVTVLMRLHKLESEAAMKLLYRKIIDLQTEYCQIRDEYIRESCPDTEMIELLAAIEFSIAGNTLWHATSPRYTSWKLEKNVQSVGLSTSHTKNKVRSDPTSELLTPDEDVRRYIKKYDYAHTKSDWTTTGSLIVLSALKLFGLYIRAIFSSISVGTLPKSMDLSAAMVRSPHPSGCICTQSTAQRQHLVTEKKDVSSAFSTDFTLGNETPPSRILGDVSTMTLSDICSKSNSYTTTTDEIPDEMITKSFQYIASLPAGGARDTLIDALDIWYQVPTAALQLIREIVATIHNISLMLDDVEDRSPRRRGAPAAHMVFGESQTINTATFMYAKCSTHVMKLSRQAMADFFYELQQLHIGQGKDLYWTFNCEAPSVAAYLECLEQKTGGLFRLASKLMQAEATINANLNITAFMTVLGRYYQLRDDYQDISDTDAKSESYDDLDQGSFTLPTIHALNFGQEQHIAEMKSILQTRNQTKSMTLEAKKLFLERLKETGSVEYTKDVLWELHKEMEELLTKAEDGSGVKNWILRLMLHRLKV